MILNVIGNGSRIRPNKSDMINLKDYLKEAIKTAEIQENGFIKLHARFIIPILKIIPNIEVFCRDHDLTLALCIKNEYEVYIS